MKLLENAPYARYITTIHDEVISDLPEDRRDDFAAAKALTEAQINAILGWDVAMRFGLAFGNNLYEAKG
jgi:DNA polymerase I-like protein with 3'-5' exonuclease and polymerase domains